MQVTKIEWERIDRGAEACLVTVAFAWAERRIAVGLASHLQVSSLAEQLSDELQLAVRSGSLFLYDTLRRCERPYRPADEEALVSGRVWLWVRSVDRWLEGQGLMPTLAKVADSIKSEPVLRGGKERKGLPFESAPGRIVGVSQSESDALRRCVATLAPFSQPHERRTMAFNVEKRIAGESCGLLAFRFDQLGVLFHPGEPERGRAVAEQIRKAADAGTLVTILPREQQGALLTDLAAWPECPPLAVDSPLRYWLPFVPTTSWVEQQTAELDNKLYAESRDAPQVVAPATEDDSWRLATRAQLIEAFGRFTGMDADWFKNLKDTPALLAARKVAGKGGRGHIAEPLFCPFEVMQWMANGKRRKGRKLSSEKAWELLEKSFPRVYNIHSVADPRQVD